MFIWKSKFKAMQDRIAELEKENAILKQKVFGYRWADAFIESLTPMMSMAKRIEERKGKNPDEVKWPAAPYKNPLMPDGNTFDIIEKIRQRNKDLKEVIG